VHLSITHLVTFSAVVQYGSMTTAAMALTYSLSTVSAHVTHLERQLRTPLFHRGADGCEPTAAGRELASHARDLIDLHDRIVIRASRGHRLAATKEQIRSSSGFLDAARTAVEGPGTS
jgi:DNA-binding transcriptional LysR family regulator